MVSAGLRQKRRREAVRNVAFLSPWLIGVSVFFLYPLISTVYFSFMRYDGFTPPTWTGLKNWQYVFTDYPFFWPALRNKVRTYADLRPELVGAVERLIDFVTE